MQDKAWFEEALGYAVTAAIILRAGEVEYGWKGDYGCTIA